MIAYRARGASTKDLIRARIAIGGYTGHAHLYDLPVSIGGRSATYLDAGMATNGEYLMTRHGVLFIVLGEAPSKGKCHPGSCKSPPPGPWIAPAYVVKALGGVPSVGPRDLANPTAAMKPNGAATISRMTRDLNRPLREAWIVEAVRTPIGRYGGALAERPARRPGRRGPARPRRPRRLDPALIEDVILGCANQAGEDNRNVARMALLLAGFPVEVGGLTVNRLCGSGSRRSTPPPMRSPSATATCSSPAASSR